MENGFERGNFSPFGGKKEERELNQAAYYCSFSQLKCISDSLEVVGEA